MSLRDIWENDASLFTSTNDFGEVVVYMPRNGTDRTITATVFRQVAEALGDDENRVLPVFEVHVANSVTTGIATTEVDLGGDQIEIADRVGKTPRPRSIVQIMEQDEGMVVYQCR